MIHTRESVLEALRSAKGASLGRKIDTLGRAAREAFCGAPARGEGFSISLFSDRPIYEAELDAVVCALNAADASAPKATVACPSCGVIGACRASTSCEVCGGAGRLPARGGPLRGEGVCSDLCIKTRGYGMQLYCTLAAGHEGDHVGHSGAGNALGTWPQAAPARERDWRVPPPFATCLLRERTGGGYRCSYAVDDVPVQWRGISADGPTRADAYADFCARIRRGYAGSGNGVARCAHDGGNLTSTKGIVCALCGATGLHLSDDAAEPTRYPERAFAPPAPPAPPAPEPPPKVDRYLAARIDRLKKAGDLGSSVLTTVEAATAACRERLTVVRRGAAQARETAAHYEAMEREIVAALAECGAKDGAS